MSATLAATPALVPLATALVGAAVAKHVLAQRVVTLVGVAVLLVCGVGLLAQVAGAGSVRLAFGNWSAPFGIEFVVDGLSACMAMITALIGAVVIVFQMSSADPAPAAASLLPLIMALLAGVGGAFVTGDLFNLYVWFEVTLLASLGLLALGGRTQNLDATLKYFVLNAVGTLLLLMGIALVYGATGHLNFDALARAGRGPEAARWLPLAGVLALALLVKAGAFPVFAWLPASYHTLPAPVLALFAGLLTKLGIYALLRVLGDVFVGAPSALLEVLGWLAVATMLSGALGAAHHWDMRRILAFHIISQIGYLLLGIALGTSAGSVATIFYLLHNILAKTNLILIAAIVFRLCGSYDLRRCGGLYAARPALAIVFMVSALAMVGTPPLSGFWAKVLLLREAFALGRGAWAVAALVTGFLTLYSMLKIWTEGFWKSHPVEGWVPDPGPGLLPAYLCVGGLGALIVGVGLAPEPLAGFLETAADALGAGRVAAPESGSARP